MDNRKYKTEQDVKDWIFNNYTNNGKSLCHPQKKAIERGIYINSKLRREILTGPNEGRVIINGKVCNIIFTSIGGGVYKVKLEE